MQFAGQLACNYASYVQSDHSDCEHALMIALVLNWSTFLMPGERGLTNNYLSRKTIHGRFQNATFEATGIEIPPKVVKQTCGHLHSQSGDASALSRLGWSNQFAFHYTWLPREIWTK